jgi:polyhydroxyalkanoate synthesis regulator phasin
MAQNDTFKRYLDAGMAFTQLSRERAEEFVKDLVKAGEVRRKEAEEVIETLLERSRKNTEDLVGLIRKEIADQLRKAGLDDLVKRAGLPGPDDAADVAPAAAPSPAATPAPAAAKKPTKKAKAAKAATPSPGSPLVVPGAPKKSPAKKLVVPSGVSKAAPKQAKKAAKRS